MHRGVDEPQDRIPHDRLARITSHGAASVNCFVDIKAGCSCLADAAVGTEALRVSLVGLARLVLQEYWQRGVE